jgi:hypothetical protein
VHSNSYRAFDSINHAPLATLGVDVEWNTSQLLQVGSYAKASTSRSTCAQYPHGPHGIATRCSVLSAVTSAAQEHLQ